MVLEQIQFALENVFFRGAALHHTVSARLLGAGKIAVLVNGSPKTGTTWVLKLIASLPGYRPAGNLRGEIEHYRRAAPGDVFHGHDFFSADLQTILDAAGIRRVLTVRDPRDQTVSRMFHLRREKRHPWHDQFVRLDDDDALLACIEGRDDETLPGVRAMMRLTESWQIHDPVVTVVRYEDLLENPECNLRQVFERLGIPVSDALLRAIVARNRFRRLTVGRRFWQKSRTHGESDERSHYRKGIRGDWMNHFRLRHKERFKQLAGETLIAWGYESDMNW